MNREILGNHSFVEINEDNFDSINKILFENQIYNSTLLSTLNVNTSILRSFETPIQYFEIIITEDYNCQSDLLYHWNKKLYENYKYPLQTILVTVQQLEELVKDLFFWNLIYKYSGEFKKIRLVSFSIKSAKLLEIKNEIDSLNQVISFDVITDIEFPFPVSDNHGQNQKDFKENSCIVISQSTTHLLNLPKLSFNLSKLSNQDKWMVDISISELSRRKNKKLFPVNTETYSLSQTSGRIKWDKQLSILVSADNNSIDLNIISFRENVKQVILYPKKINKQREYLYDNCGLSDQSNLLKQFINLFNDDFYLIEEYLHDKFWFELFDYLSINTRVEGDTITFREIIERLNFIFQEINLKLDTKEKTFRNEENLKLGVQMILQELLNQKIFQPGFILKCKSCSSSLWYSLNETQSILKCKGCSFQNNFKAELPISYKLNHLIKNTFGMRDKDGKYSPHGNLTVVRTLIHLHTTSTNFEYSPQLDIYKKYNDTRPITDLDIICMADGNLYIGEAKHNSSEFKKSSHKCLTNLLSSLAQK